MEARASVDALKADFEKRLSMLGSSMPSTPQLSAREATILFAGFGDDCDAACLFINSELDKISMQHPAIQYYKGDEFKGRVFCQYGSGQVADDTVRAFASRTLVHNGRKISCKPDLPFNQRVPVSFLLGLRR